MTLHLDKRYLEHKAHPLEDAIVEAYQFFDGFKRAGSGKLTAHMIDEVLTSFPALIPVEIKEIFTDLLR